MFNKDEIRQNFSFVSLLKKSLIVFLSTAMIATGSVILSDATKLIEINDGEKSYYVKTLMGDVRTALRSVGLRSDNYKVLSSKTIANTTSVNIEYLFPVYITKGNKTEEHFTSAATVGEILTEAGYSVDEFDMVEPGADTVINNTVYIDFTDIEYVKGNYTESIAYNSVTKTDGSMPEGTEKTEAGTEGVQQVNFTDKYVNGEKVDTVIDGTVVLTAAVDEVKTVGTLKSGKPGKAVSKPKNPAVKTSSDVKSVSTLKPEFDIELDANGVPVNYKKVINSRATAYTYSGQKCATGVNPQPGYIAVNPKYIPYGSKLYIRTPDGSVVYGYAVAADTGGFIRRHPTGVDLFMSSKSACVNFGVRNVEIYFL